MCTISWLVADDGLRVHFNRDERRTRETAAPPHLWRGNPHPFIAPIDTRGGGTWLAVSADGTVRALLNHYGCPPQETAGETSRGMVPSRLASGEWHLTDLLENPDRLAGIAPFHLLTLTATSATRHTWDGEAWRIQTVDSAVGCFTTSSWKPLEVSAFRLAAFSKFTAKGRQTSPADLEHFHDGLETTGNPATSVVMDRPETRTVSQTRIHVHHGRVAVSYRERDPTGDGFSPHWVEVRLNALTNP